MNRVTSLGSVGMSEEEREQVLQSRTEQLNTYQVLVIHALYIIISVHVIFTLIVHKLITHYTAV